MAVEKISSVQQVQVVPVQEKQTEEQTPVVQKSSGSSKDVVTALSILAALGAAGVAIYKHNNAKKMVEEAQNAAKKKVEEAEDKVKKAAEETENKIKEAVDKVRKEYENVDKKTDGTSKPAKNKKKKAKENKDDGVEKPAPKILEGGVRDDSLGEVCEPFLERIDKETNGLIVIPSTTKLSKYFTRIKNKFNQIKTKKGAAETPKPAEETTNAEKRNFKDRIKTFYDNIKAKFKREPEKTDVSVKPETPVEPDVIEKPEVNVVPEASVKPEAEEKISRLKVYGEKFSESSKQAKDYIVKKWNEFLGLFRRKKFEPEIAEEELATSKIDYRKIIENSLKTEPAPSEIFIGINMPDVTKIAEKDLITEYNSLSKIVKDLPVEDMTAQRFLQIKGELLNHRGYKVMPDGTIKKSVIKPKDEPKIINQKPLDNVSDLELLIEYNILRKKVQKLPVMSEESQRFLQIQGELLNHRNYLISDGRLVKRDLTQTLRKAEERVKKWKENAKPAVEEKERLLDGKISVIVPKKPTNYEHKKLQAEYDKLAIVPEKAKIKTKTIEELKQQIEQAWKENAKPAVEEKERLLDGKITVEVPRKPRKTWHNKIQKQLEKVFDTKNEAIPKTEQKIAEGKNERIDGLSAVQPIKTHSDTDSGENVVKGLNELPESFNEKERFLIKNIYGRRQSIYDDKVTEYPKLYPGKKERKQAIRELFDGGIPSLKKITDFIKIMRAEKNAKKAYEKAKKNHIQRRVKEFAHRVGQSDEKIATSVMLYTPDSMKYSSKKYKSMMAERPNPEDWDVEMTRDEFMKNKEQYILDTVIKEQQEFKDNPY